MLGAGVDEDDLQNGEGWPFRAAKDLCLVLFFVTWYLWARATLRCRLPSALLEEREQEYGASAEILSLIIGEVNIPMQENDYRGGIERRRKWVGFAEGLA